MPAQREPLPIVAAAFGLLTAGLLAARAFGVPVEWEVILTAAGIGGLDTARSLLGAGVKALRPVVAPPLPIPNPFSLDLARDLGAARSGAAADIVQVRDLVEPDALAVALYGAYNAGGDPETAGLNYAGHRCPVWGALPVNVQRKWGAAALLAHDLAAGKPAAAERFAYLLAEAAGAYPRSVGSLPPAPAAAEPAE